LLEYELPSGHRFSRCKVYFFALDKYGCAVDSVRASYGSSIQSQSRLTWFLSASETSSILLASFYCASWLLSQHNVDHNTVWRDMVCFFQY
jgi:hypothetical protein